MKKLFYLIFIFMAPMSAQAQVSDANQAVSFMSSLSTQIVHRSLTASEVSQIRSRGSAAFPEILRAWFAEPKFLDSAQHFVENLLRTNGVSAGVDYNLPAYLGRDIARRERPYSELVTANRCVNLAGDSINCDTGAPYTSGVLTTRAFMATNAGPYNIGRAGKLVSKFLCTTYPLPETEEPKIAQADMIPQFATTSGQINFGNGNNCYSCHSQFGHHTQFFVKFDLTGNFRSNATGLQNAGATDGFSTNSTLTSHFQNATRASAEMSQFLGKPAANLAAAATHLSQSSRFLPCAVKNLMAHYLRLTSESMDSIKPGLYTQISDNAKTLRADPSISHLLTSIITNQHVYDSFKNSGAQP